jgi:hypothetical protein
MVLAVGFLLLVSLVITAGLAVLRKFFGEILPMPELLMHTDQLCGFVRRHLGIVCADL